MTRLFTLIVIAAISAGGNCFAQGYSISGKVKDGQQAAVAFANVSLLQAKDSSWVQTVASNEEGAYELQHVVAGKYIIDVQLLGFAHLRRLQIVTGDIKGLDIVLEKKGNALDEVVIQGRQDRIQTEQGKTIVNISENMKTGTNLLDLLKNMPGVHVSPDGTVSMDGKQGIVVLVDDKPTNLNGKELADYLKSVNASEVAKVELMTQPSARYDAEGNSGIISIKMNKQKRDGWKGVATTRYEQGKYPFVAANSNISYRKNKATYTLNPGYYKGMGFLKSVVTSNTTQDGEPKSAIKETSFRKEHFPDYSLKAGVDYDVTDKTVVAVSAKGIYHTNGEVDKTNTVIEDVATGNRIYNNATNLNGHKRTMGEMNLFAKHDIDSDQNLQLNAGYFFKNRNLYQKLNSTSYDNDGLPLPEPLILNNTIPDKTDLYTAKLDYTGKINKAIKIECGVKSSYALVDEENNFEQYIDNNWIKDTLRSNKFLYDEHINAAYVSCSGQAGKIQVQGGVRVEHTHAEGNQVTQDKQFVKDYTSVFPTAYVTYKIDSQNTVECNYGRRLQRPNYHELNPFSWVASAYRVNEGNPLLSPQFTHNLELKHNYKGHLITTLTCSQVKGVFTDRLRYNKATNVSIYSVGNNGRKFNTALSAFFNNQLLEWLNVSTGGSVFYTEYEADYFDQHYFATGTGFTMNLDTQLTFKKGWSAQLNTAYRSRFRSSVVQTVGAWPWVDAAISKNMFKDTVAFKLSVQDPFYLYHYNYELDQPGVSVASSSQFNTQAVSLAFTYNFGKRDELRRRDNVLEESRRM